MPKKKKKKKTNPLLAASTLLPLAIGVASGGLPSRPVTPEAAAGKAFRPGCTLPFDAIKERHPIDKACGLTGNASGTTAQALQNRAKNNFCAPGAPINVDFEVFHQLQRDAEGVLAGHGLPKDRSVLRNLATKAGSLGEDTVVRLAAFVIDAHVSNKSKGESVNCKKGGEENNDIHIVLGEKSNHEDPCASVTAEISPHFRPSSWDSDIMQEWNEHLFRFTGHLFYDASHSPCSAGKRPSPQRSSLWEIHPVYGVEICADSSNNCTVGSDANWVALSDWAGGEETDETGLWLPDEILSASGAAPSPVQGRAERPF